MTRQYTGKYRTQVCTQGDCRNPQYQANSQSEGTSKESRVCQKNTRESMARDRGHKRVG